MRLRSAAHIESPLEETEQAALFAWLEIASWRGAPLAWRTFAVPNGAFLAGSERQRAAQVARLKTLGLRVGFPDVGLLIAQDREYVVPPAHGLFIVMKRRFGGRESKLQHEWRRILRHEGYACEICEGADRAKETIKKYVAGTGCPIVFTTARPSRDVIIGGDQE
jgi:hypothetical protein